MSRVPEVAVEKHPSGAADASPPLRHAAAGRTHSKWVLALQMYHALQEQPGRDDLTADDVPATILDELVGASALDKGDSPLCGIVPSSSSSFSSFSSFSSSSFSPSSSSRSTNAATHAHHQRASWVIPARGTPEHAHVSAIHQRIKTEPLIEHEARELTRLRAENARMVSLLSYASAVTT